MMATIIYRLEKEPDVVFRQIFADVPDGQWFTKAVTWGSINEVVWGYDNGNFGPGDNVTREQLISMLYRYAAKKGFDVSGRTDLSTFADADKVSGYAKDAMSWAVGKGIVTGSGSKLNPEGTATRAHFAVFLYRYSNG